MLHKNKDFRLLFRHCVLESRKVPGTQQAGQTYLLNKLIVENVIQDIFDIKTEMRKGRLFKMEGHILTRGRKQEPQAVWANHGLLV